MSLFKNVYYEACSLLPMNLVRKSADMQLLLPYHHTVSSKFLPHVGHLYDYKNERQFIKDLDFLLKYYTPISERELLSKLSNGVPVKKSFLLTFDDGFKEVHDNIAPILEHKGVPAVFFLNPAFIGNQDLFYRCKISLLIHELKKHETQKGFVVNFTDSLGLTGLSTADIIRELKKITQETAAVLDVIANKIDFSFQEFLQLEQPFLTEGQVQSLVGRGFAIGGHSVDHPYYNMLSLDEQYKQTTESCDAINHIAGQKMVASHFPTRITNYPSLYSMHF